MRVDYSDDLDGSNKLQSGKHIHIVNRLLLQYLDEKNVKPKITFEKYANDQFLV